MMLSILDLANYFYQVIFIFLALLGKILPIGCYEEEKKTEFSSKFFMFVLGRVLAIT